MGIFGVASRERFANSPARMETTLILLKPDCVKKGLCGEVLGRFEKAGFKLRGCKCFEMTDALVEEHYAHLLDKPFFGELKTFMQSTPVVALALSTDNAVEKARELMGPTDSKKAAPGTIRGDLGEDVMLNIVHGSDSVENAGIELKRFFADGELV